MLNKVINIVQCYIVLYSVLQSCMVLYSAILCDSVALHKEMGRLGPGGWDSGGRCLSGFRGSWGEGESSGSD